MRIGILHQYGLESSGSGLYVTHLAKALLRRGHHVCLVSREPDAARLDWITDVRDEHDEEPDAPGAEGTCRAYRVSRGVAAVAYPRAEAPGTPTFAELSDAELQGWLTGHADAVTRIAAQEDLDVLHANHEVPMAYVAREAGRRLGIPYVVVAHGSTLEYVYARDPRYVPITREGLADAGRLVVLTSELRERLRAICPEAEGRIATVSAGVDLDVFVPREAGHDAPAPPAVAYVGRMSLEKGVHVLLAAFPEVVRQVPEARLRLVGEGVVRDAMASLVVALDEGELARAEAILRDAAAPGEEAWLTPVLEHWRGAGREGAAAVARAARLGERVSFTGQLGPRDVARELRGADVVAVPSLVREAFPLVMLEALAAGVPPVAADHGGLSAVLDEFAPALGELGADLRVPTGPDLVDALAQRLVAVLRRVATPTDSARWRARCRALAVERYGWDRVAGDLEDAYVAVLATTSGAAR